MQIENGMVVYSRCQQGSPAYLENVPTQVERDLIYGTRLSVAELYAAKATQPPFHELLSASGVCFRTSFRGLG